MRDWGLDTRIETFEALLPYPTKRLLEVPGFKASLAEPAVSEDSDTAEHGQIPLYNAYAASGDVTAPLVYVNYGTPEDYAAFLKNDRNTAARVAKAANLKPEAQAAHAEAVRLFRARQDQGFKTAAE